MTSVGSVNNNNALARIDAFENSVRDVLGELGITRPIANIVNEYCAGYFGVSHKMSEQVNPKAFNDVWKILSDLFVNSPVLFEPPSNPEPLEYSDKIFVNLIRKGDIESLKKCVSVLGKLRISRGILMHRSIDNDSPISSGSLARVFPNQLHKINVIWLYFNNSELFNEENYANSSFRLVIAKRHPTGDKYFAIIKKPEE